MELSLNELLVNEMSIAQLLRTHTNPPAHAIHDLLPFVRVAHDNFPAFAIVRGNSHFGHIVWPANIQRFIDFEFNGQTVAIPAEAPFNVIALLMGISSDNVFDGSGQNVSVMRQSGCKRWTIVERITVKVKRECHVVCEWKLIGM